MKLLKPLIAGALGTTFMTLYSYGYSYWKKKQFREPQLLAHLIKGPEGPFRKDDLVQGWFAHYLVGAVFALSYQQFLQGKFINNPTIKAPVFGGLYGIAGVLGWKATIKKHPNPPKINYQQYYGHLIVAHIIFGSLAFSFLERTGNDKNKKSRHN